MGGIGGSSATGGFWGALAGLGVAGGILYFLREYLLYMVKAGHIAVLVELMEGKKDLPGGRGQISHAQAIVKERFAESNVLFVLDRLITGILKAFNRLFLTVAGIIPLPGLDSAVKFIGRVVTMSLTYLDEVILSYNFRTRSENPWKSGQTALVLYAQNYKAFLKNAVWLVFVVWGLTFLVFLVVLAPVGLLVSQFPGTAGFLTLVVALVFAWAVKQAVIDPFAMTALMQVFYAVTEGQVPNPEWEAKLDSASKKFGELKEKAAEWGSGPAPQSQEVPMPST